MRFFLLFFCLWINMQGLTSVTLAQNPSSIPSADVVSQASVWFMPYPASVITRPNESVLEMLGSSAYWNVLQKLSIQGIYLGNTKKSNIGSNRISFLLDDSFGTQAQYQALASRARAMKAFVFEDTISLSWGDEFSSIHELMVADMVRAAKGIGVSGFCLNFQSFLEQEASQNNYYPLTLAVSADAASIARGLGAWSFQKLDISLDAFSAFVEEGADLFYDTWSWPTHCYALLTGDAGLLRTMLRLIQDHNIQPKQLIHSLQEPDPIKNTLAHFMVHADDFFTFRGEQVPGKQLQAWFVEQMCRLGFNKAITENGSEEFFCTTSAGLCAIAFGINDPYNSGLEGIRTIQEGHLLMAFFNAMQPGIFLFSGWDLVGALPLTEAQLNERFEQGDYRWVSRGAYDLLNINSEAIESSLGLPRAQALYGSVTDQLKKPESFVSRLKHIIDIRQKIGIASAKRISIPQVDNRGVIILVHELPNNKGTQMTAVNFGRAAVEEFIPLEGLAGYEAKELLKDEPAGQVSEEGIFSLRLNALEGKVFLFEQFKLLPSESESSSI